MFEFEYPFLIFLIFLPILFLIKLNLQKHDSNTIITYPNIKNLQSTFGSFISNKFSVDKIISYLIWVLLVLAIMHPQLVDKKINISTKGRNIMIIADLSGSMRALDFSTKDKYINRLDVLKETTNSFISKRVGDNIGLILFADNAYNHVPLTSDLKSLQEMLSNTFIGMAGESTAIGDAIGLAVKKLRNFDSEASTIILLTDGENTAGTLDPITSSKIAKEYDIKIYVIGIGKSGIAPVADERGYISRMQVKIDEVALKNIAKTTNGKYFNVTSKDVMERIYEEINQLEKVENEARELLIKKQLYHIPLIGVILLLFLLILLPFKDYLITKNARV